MLNDSVIQLVPFLLVLHAWNLKNKLVGDGKQTMVTRGEGVGVEG